MIKLNLILGLLLSTFAFKCANQSNSGPPVTLTGVRNMQETFFPIFNAIDQGDKKSLVKLLDGYPNKVDNKNSEGETPLLYALKNNEHTIVEEILRYNPDVNSQNKQGESPLHLVLAPTFDSTKLYHSKHDTTNQSRQQHVAAMVDFRKKVQENLIKQLLEKGADANRQDNNGNSPLSHAVARHHIPCTKILLQYGADPNRENGAKTSFFANANPTIIHPLCRVTEGANIQEATKMLTFISNKMAPVTLNKQDKNSKMAPIHWAAASNNEQLGILIDAGVNLNIQDEKGNTPLHYIVERYTSNITEEKSKDVLAGVKLLCAREGVDLNIQNKAGDTPLHLATKLGHKGVCELLITQGAKATISNNYGEKVLELLAKVGWGTLLVLHIISLAAGG